MVCSGHLMARAGSRLAASPRFTTSVAQGILAFFSVTLIISISLACETEAENPLLDEQLCLKVLAQLLLIYAFVFYVRERRESRSGCAGASTI